MRESECNSRFCISSEFMRFTSKGIQIAYIKMKYVSTWPCICSSVQLILSPTVSNWISSWLRWAGHELWIFELMNDLWSCILQSHSPWKSYTVLWNLTHTCVSVLIYESCNLVGQSSWLNKGDVLCFLWGTNWIYICYVEESRPPLWSSGQSSWLHKGDILCFLWGTNWIYICCVEESRPPLWSSGQSSWLQIRRSGSHSRRYQIFWEVVCLERGPLGLVSTTEELLERKSIGFGLENR
jgi:hypothetical protein